jgi:hypothetical protein
MLPSMPLAAAYATSSWKLWPARVAWFGLEVELVLAVEAVAGQEPVHDRRLGVVLMLGRLHGLGLDQQRALEADAVLVLGNQVEEACQLGALAAKVGVEQGVIALAPAPQHIVRATKAPGHLEHVLHLGRCIGEDLGVGVGGGACGVSRVAEQVGGAPQQADTGPLLESEGVVGEGVEVAPELRERGAIGGDVAVVEAVEGGAELGEELECGGHLGPGRVHLVARRVDPGPLPGSRPEHVAARRGEGVPVGDGDPEMVLHALAEHDTIGIVDLE